MGAAERGGSGMTRRGRKLGELQNPRDERGWMIPRPGTVRRKVYNALVSGLGWAELGMCRLRFSTHKQAIVSGERVREWRREEAI